MALDDLGLEPTSHELFDLLLRTQPADMKEWVQRHPRNLMLLLGWDVERHHAQALKDVLTHKQTFWLAPRGSGKSTTFQYATTWMALADPEVYTKHGIPYLFEGSPHTIGPHNIRLGITSNSAENAAQLVGQAKQAVMDDRIAQLFGNLMGERWQNRYANTALRTANLRETTFTAMGLGSRITGQHFDVILEDDWVTEENARTELQRNRLSDFWNMTVKGAHEPWSKDVGAGTRYDPLDWYGTGIMKMVEIGTWANLRRTMALYKDADGELQSYWPSFYSVKQLLNIKAEIGTIAFATQYQNQTDVVLSDFFARSWLENFAKWDDLDKETQDRARTIIALDPAIKAGPRNDYTAFCVLSMVGGKYYVRRIVRGQWTDEDMKKRARILVAQYGAELLGVEVVGGIEWLADSLARDPEMGCRVRKLKPMATTGKSKAGRASSIRKFMEQGRVFFEEPTKENGIGRLTMEMSAFPGASSQPGMDDCVDAFVWSMLLTSSVARGRTIKLSDRRNI